uniref:Resistance gene n=1 Tax=Solanum tuberosum TaxID=4113 RepID=M1C4W3_SOLTU
MKPELDITMSDFEIRELPLSIIHFQPHLRERSLSFMKNLVSIPSSICKLKGLVKLDVSFCSKIESLPEEIGYLEKLELLDASYTLISQPPSSIIRLNKLKSLSFAKYNTRGGVFFVFRMKGYVHWKICISDGGLLEGIGYLSSLKVLNLKGNNFEHLPRSIAQLGSLRSLDLSKCRRLKEFLGVSMAEGLCSLEELDLSDCNLIDGGLPEDIGCLSSLKVLNLKGNNFEHLPRSIAQLGSLRSLDLSKCRRLKEFLGVSMAEGLCSLEELDLSDCNLIDGGLPEDIGCLSSLKVLNLSGNNFEYLPQSIAQLGTLQVLDLSHCKKLTQLPEFSHQLDTIEADWSNDSFCNSLFQNISSLQHDISVSDSLSLTVFVSWPWDIPRWFHYQGMVQVY